jgi:hypothetical protein
MASKNNNTMTLESLFQTNTYDTDKYDLGYITELYESLFSAYKNKSINLLEIGVQRGGSIILWNDYFSKSKIYTLDIENCAFIENLRNVTQIISDAYHNDTVNKFANDMFDIIIDDGPHTYQSFEYLIVNYYNKLAPNGIMVIEDIININWTPSLVTLAESIGYSKIEVVQMGGKQKTQQMLQMWSPGLDVLVLRK